MSSTEPTNIVPLRGARVRFESPQEAYTFWQDRQPFFEQRGYRLQPTELSEEETAALFEAAARRKEWHSLADAGDDRLVRADDSL